MEVDMDSDMEIDDKEDDCHLIHHVVLPRVLPKKMYNTSTDLDLMYKMVCNIKSLAKYIPAKTVDLFRKLIAVYADCTPEAISNTISNLDPGETFPMYVQEQGYALTIYVPTDEQVNNVQNVIVATFPGSLDPNEIYSHDSGLEVNYPERAIKVKFSSMLRSEDFANQLSILNEVRPYLYNRRDCISKWLPTVLMNSESTAASEKEFPVITKKVRDELLGSEGDYFRRSGFYMSIKAMLQHSLTHQMGPVVGKYLYKIVILKFLIVLWDPYTDDPFDIDLVSQMIAKMARRIEKLHIVRRNEDILNDYDSINSLYDEVINEAKQTIAETRRKIDDRIQRRQSNDKKKAELPRITKLNFERDIVYDMSKLKDHLVKRENIHHEVDENAMDTDAGSSTPNNDNDEEQSNATDEIPLNKSTYERHFETTRLPDIEIAKKLAKSRSDQRLFWMDFERFVLYEMKMGMDRWSSQNLRDWSFTYAKFAETTYKDNPLFVSRMLLVRLKLIALLDERTTDKYPLLRKYRSGITTNIIDCLLLPHHADMVIAFEIEEYFRKRNHRASHPGLIERKSIDETSFAVQFAREDPDMIEIRNEILAIDKENIAKKFKEWESEREKASQLRTEANNLSCENSRTAAERNHARQCRKCALRKDADEIKISVYERLLPRDESEQFAIVFELKIPNRIACLRDVLFNFGVYCTKNTQGKRKRTRSFVNWNQLLRDFNQTKFTHVKLGTTKSSKRKPLPVWYVFDHFHESNSNDCVYHCENQLMPPAVSTPHIKEVCTFKTQDEYADLQWFIESTNQTENQVLASQSKCKSDLTLNEYRTFGFLRCDGHRLQLHRLYGMMETESLSLEKESVLLLIMQTLWEAGIKGDANAIRETHANFADAKFCDAIVKLLSKFVEQQKNNWMHPFKLLVAALIAIRAFEINNSSGLANDIAELLSNIRAIASKWIDTIQNKMTNRDENTECGLRMKLIYVSIIGGVTFFVHPKHEHFQKIFRISANGNESCLWLRFIISLKNNVRMYTNDDKKLSTILRMFLQLMDCVGLSLEKEIKELITPHQVFDLVRKQWTRAEYATFKGMSFQDDCPNILAVTVNVATSDQTVTIDIILGTFLVDGNLLSILPDGIINSEIYKSFFGNVVFEVQPDGLSGFATKQKYNNCSYEFKIIDKKIIITEHNFDLGFEKELIDRRVLKEDFPHNLVNEYSHWWDRKKNCIEFRHRASKNVHFTKQTSVDYRLSLRDRYLIHVQTNRPLLDIKSESFVQITRQLSRLEHSKYIQIQYLADAREAIVELYRMNLKFTITRSGSRISDLKSNEFGMRISQNQRLGTLYGLDNGLLLESNNGAFVQKIFLIPNGKISIKKNGIFARVKIDTEGQLQNPPFYTYKVDKFSSQLKSSNGSHASWFYLAYLHAITSTGEVETFTGMSGSERALQILQSAFAWSSSPYEPEAIKMLGKLGELAPIRRLENNIQHVTWPKFIPSRSAQDCFVFVADKLLADSLRLSSLHSDCLDKRIKFETNLKLNERDYRRCQPLNPNLRVSDAFIERKVLRTSPPTSDPIPFCDDTRLVCMLYHKGQFRVPIQLELLKTFLTGDTTRTLNGLGNSDRLVDVLNHCDYEGFRDMWISLYDAAIRGVFNPEQFAIILSFYAHRREKIQPILTLQTVVMNRHRFEHIKPPRFNEFKLSEGTFKNENGTFKEDVINDIIEKHFNPPNLYGSQEWADNGYQKKCDDLVKWFKTNVTTQMKTNWPCFSLQFAEKFAYVDMNAANIAINEKLKVWFANYELEVFIKNVEETLNSLRDSGVRPFKVPSCAAAIHEPKNWPQMSIDFDKKIEENVQRYQNEIAKARDVWEMKSNDNHTKASDWWRVCTKIFNALNARHLTQSGLLPRAVPSLLLPKILDPQFNYDLKCLIGAYAIAVAREQYQLRIRIYRNSMRSELQAALDREEESDYENWSPREYSEWLLFQIEQNLSIRRIQIAIAKRMIEPGDADGIKHYVMQLNMGEGKTSVIVPILAAKLADGTQVCQIIVLKSLFATNLKTLRQQLGGYLNRRIYIFPCRRDMPIESHAQEILNIYEECKREKGVILALPEHRLSFQLKIYESIAVQLKTEEAERNFKAAKTVLDMHKWTNANIRTILDESDAILHAKYQLIYTVGKQMQPDGTLYDQLQKTYI